MKQLFILLFACFAVSSAFGNNDEIQRLVLEGEKQWNAGNPDKSFLSAGNSIEYGLGYLKKNKFTESLWYFDEVIKKEGNHGYANFFAGLANTGLKNFAAADSNFSKLVGIDANLMAAAKSLLQKARQEVAQKAPAKNREKTTTPTAPQNTATAKPTDTRPANESAAAAENRKGGSLVYGDYVFTLDYWDVSQRRMVHQQKGVFTMNANGTYRYMGTTGRYSYNAATGVITWQSGTFKNMGKNTTTFQRNKTTCEIDFEYDTNGGKVYYSGGRNL